MDDNQRFQRITELSEKGNVLMDAGEYSKARELFLEAFSMVQEHWGETALWLDAAIGDSYYQEGQYEKALKYFQDAYYAIGGKLNDYVLFMNGMCYFNLGNKKDAWYYLRGAYVIGGLEMFEDEDPECIQLAKASEPPCGAEDKAPTECPDNDDNNPSEEKEGQIESMPLDGVEGELRFDGFYFYIQKVPESRRYNTSSLRFYDDGTVIQSNVTVIDPEYIPPDFDKDSIRQSHYKKGTYTMGDKIDFTITSPYGSVDYTGIVYEGYIILDWHSNINGAEGKAERYVFRPFRKR